MLPSRSTVRRHVRQLTRHLVMRSLVSVGVMAALQVGASLSSAPPTDEATPRLTVRTPRTATAPVRRVVAGELEAIATGREARLPVPARLAALAANASNSSEPAAEPMVRVAALRMATDAVMFDTCLPECESRDPLLARVSLASTAVPPAKAPSVLAEAEPVTVPTVPDAPAHDSLFRAATRRGTAIAGAAAASAMGQVIRLTTGRNDQ